MLTMRLSFIDGTSVGGTKTVEAPASDPQPCPKSGSPTSRFDLVPEASDVQTAFPVHKDAVPVSCR